MIWKHLPFQKPTLQTIGSKQEIKDANFGCQFGVEEPPFFEEGLCARITQVENQLCHVHDLDPRLVRNKLAEQRAHS